MEAGNMPEKQKFCPKCGIANKVDAKFCRSCGEQLAMKGLTAAETMQKASEVVNTVSSTVSKVESAVSTAGKIAQTAGELSHVVIRPPAEWKVVVGEILPTTGQKMVDSAVVTAENRVQQQVQQKVQEEVVRQVSQMISKPEPVAVPESVVPSPAPPKTHPVSQQQATPAPACRKCGNPLKPGAKFCGVCGSATGAAGKGETMANVPQSQICPSCGNSLTPGKKFCGSCGYKLG